MRMNVFTNHAKWLADQIQQITKSAPHNYMYKIVGKDLCEQTKEEKLIIQIAGKNAFMHVTPKQLMLDEGTLRGFSPLDIRTITYLACQIENAPKEKKWLYRVIAQFFSKNRKEEMFIIQTSSNTSQITKSAQEISSDPELINKFHPEDAHKIGYISGTEQMTAESDFILEQKAKSTQVN